MTDDWDDEDEGAEGCEIQPGSPEEESMEEFARARDEALAAGMTWEEAIEEAQRA